MNVDVIGGNSDGTKLRKTVEAGKLLFQGNVKIGSAVLSLSKNKCTVFQFYGRRLHCTFASDATCRICTDIPLPFDDLRGTRLYRSVFFW